MAEALWISGRNRARTCDPFLVREVLSQLSYSPKVSSAAPLCSVAQKTASVKAPSPQPFGRYLVAG